MALKLSLLILGFMTFLPLAQARWMTAEEAGSVVEKFLIDYNITSSGTFTETVEYVVRVQSEDAKTNVGLFPIEYNATSDTVEILEAFTMNGKEKILVEPSAIETRDKGEAKDYDAQKVRSVVFPQVQIGSRLHLKYRMRCEKPLMAGRWSEEFTLSPGQLIEKFAVTVQSELPLYYQVEDPRKLVSLHQKNPKNIEFHSRHQLLGWVHAEKDVFFHPSGFSNIRISTHKDWPEFFHGLDKDFLEVESAPLPKALSSWVSNAKKIKEPTAQILFLMEKMSREFRYFGDWRRNKGALVPRTLAEIEKSRYGDCKDLATLLTVLLRNLKIDANVALVRRGSNPWILEPDYTLPDLNRFNHAIVQAKIGKEVYWLDATNPVSSLRPIPDISGRPAWILQPNSGHFERVPATQISDYQQVYTHEYKFSGVDRVQVLAKADLQKMAGYHVANDLMMMPRSEVLSEVLEQLTEGLEIRKFHYVKEPTTTRALNDVNVALEYDSGRVTFEAGKFGFFPIPDGSLTGAFYETEGRESDLKLADEPISFQGVRRLKETRLAQVAPEPCHIESEWVDMERRITVEGHDVVILQSVQFKKPYVTQAEYRTPAFHKLQMASKKCFYRAGILIEPLNGAL